MHNTMGEFHIMIRKKARHKSIHATWFHSYEVQGQIEQIMVLEVTIVVTLGEMDLWPEEDTNEALGILVIFFLDLRGGYTNVFTLWKLFYSHYYMTISLGT